MLCLSGILLSLLSITGAWLVVMAAGLLYWCRPEGSVPLWLIAAIVLAGVALEIIDFIAGKIGISRRGGSAAAGWAALVGGLIGMVLGAFIPIPLFGSLIGMCAGSFVCAFAVERRRLQHDAQAAHIAWGAVWARLAVMFIKTVAALALTAGLWFVVLAGPG